jgi:oxygen-dependent protoporphyrinogen oxidase
MTGVVVVGGGITGLAAAFELRRSPRPPEVTLLEASDRVGGKISTTEFGGQPIDAGADAFLARVPWALELCRELGLADELVAPSASTAYVWWHGRLHPLPDGLVLGVPKGLGSLARSDLLTWRGKLRAAAEPLLPRTSHDDNLAATIRRRFGAEVFERLVGPLVGSINAADPERLSLSASTPQLSAVVDDARSVLLGLRRTPPAASGAPVFLTHPEGLGHVVDVLAGRVQADGATIRTSASVERIERCGDRWTVDGTTADAVVLAVPADVAARVLTAVAPDSSALLGRIRYASVALATLSFSATDIPSTPSGSGYLVPVAAQRHVTACSFGSSKWAHWGGRGRIVLRASLGRDGDEHALASDDEALVAMALADVRLHLGIDADPIEARLSRWPRSFPQYEPGHLGLVDRIEASLPPGLVVAGAALHGIGIPACIRQGRDAGRRALHIAAGHERMGA